MLKFFKTEASPEIRTFNQVQWSQALQQAMRRVWRTAPPRGTD